jgi:hypothetical protein
VGGFEAILSGNVEPTVKYHSYIVQSLTYLRTRWGPCVAGSFGGALSSIAAPIRPIIENRKIKIRGTMSSNRYKQFGQMLESPSIFKYSFA